MSLRQSPENRFLTASPGRIFVSTALPMLAIMVMNGMLGIIDAVFLGHFVGADAMAAVGMAFPVLMLTIALSTLVSGGMSSLLARQLGADDRNAANATFADAHGLALTIASMLIVIFCAGGWNFALRVAGSDGPVAEMVWVFLALTMFGTPIQFLLGVHADAWRNEGRAGLMALMSLGVTLINILLNYILVAVLELGVAGSATGTVLAQALGLVLLAGLRPFLGGMMPLNSLWRNRWTGSWRRIVALGAPVSLSFVGMALSSASVVLALRLAGATDYATTIAAYGIVTRIFGFAFLPIMAIAMAMQSIVGNNVGARLYTRSDAVLRIAAATALLYCLAVEVLLLSKGTVVGAAFVADPDVIGEVGRLLRRMAAVYLFSGPVLVLGLYFQAIGQPARAALLTMVKPLILLPVLVTIAAAMLGADAIWFAYPLADGAAAVIATLVLAVALKARGTAGIGLKALGSMS
ncbi:MATE family efflux transporter [Rhizobium sp. S95]|uniref:Multidrug export protein MepA n=1 Tax=Ciceribacter sichuanensis TaxID=2949647 RepID=A0AAJ1BUG1_9HYPH|nr:MULTISPECIES: MATE family efflux transporter [unclassified Ciceribacter]MCM2395066.1 MATE family efflux transporter [Ciceribacter sp. S95]MCO5955488.1 MATE family efflux transporter [Ciceribacter sp. S101]